MKRKCLSSFLGACALALGTWTTSASAESFRLIVQTKEASATTRSKLASEVDARYKLRLRDRGATSGPMVLETDSGSDLDQQQLLEWLRERADVKYAVADRRRQAHAIPSDPLVANQWYLQSTEASAIRATTAWDITTGNANVVVAVLDSGVRFDHPDLLRVAQGGKLLPGYDFVSGDRGGALTANDGDARDPDPTDPGDWISQADLDRSDGFFTRCGGGTAKNLPTSSSWHGTRVAGIIGASTDNGIGIAGSGWNTLILPLRVLGKCGGYDSDIVAAMQWAAGIAIPGVPANLTPAKVINMSLGSISACAEPYASLITQLNAMGVVIVASAGNEGGLVDEPANCPGAIAVAGLRHAGTKVGYSSIGPEVAIAAPAGNCVNLSGACLFELTTTSNAGSQQPVAGGTYTDQGFSANIGTSFSAPLAAGVAALMFAANESLSAAEIRARMREGASPFPIGTGVPVCHVPVHLSDFQVEECTCTTSTCGAGMLNAENAVRAAQRPNASIAVPGVVTSGASVTLDGSISAPAAGRTLSNFAWSVTGTCETTTPSLTTSDQSALVLNAPMSGIYLLRLTVTDSVGAIDSSYVTLSALNATSTDSAPTCPAAPAVVTPPSAGGGGGGSLTWFLVFLLLGLRTLQSYVGISRTSFCKY